MWIKYLKNNSFLMSLYEEMPKLKDVRITQFELMPNEEVVKLVFDMPAYATNPLDEWSAYNCDTVIVHLKLELVSILAFELINLNNMSDIEIFEDERKHLNLKIRGGIKVDLIAKSGSIQDVDGYCLGVN